MRNDLFLKSIGAKVKAIRKSKRISVRTLGEMCGTDYANLSRFENGQINTNILLLKTIAEQLQIDLKELL